MKKIITILSFSLYLNLGYSLDLFRLSEGNNSFALTIYQELSNQHDNLCISPYSLTSALSMTYVGAKGETKEQMAVVLHYDKDPLTVSGGFSLINQHLMSTGCIPQVEIANSLWIQEEQTLLPDFLEVITRDYFSGIHLVDFVSLPQQTLENINFWVSQCTHGKIPVLLSAQDISPDTRSVLVNTIYLNAEWDSPFDPHKTNESPFYLDNGEVKQVPMMHKLHTYPYLRNERYAMLQLPYRVDHCGMCSLACIILLPHEDQSLKEVEETLTDEDIQQLFSGMRPLRLSVSLPVFTLEGSYQLSTPLQKMGMIDPFSCQADFSGMTGLPEFFISTVVQKTFLDFTEKGTEAVAATGVAMDMKCIPDHSRPDIFRADRPFIFFIVDQRTHTILFMGKLSNPA